MAYGTAVKFKYPATSDKHRPDFFHIFFLFLKNQEIREQQDVVYHLLAAAAVNMNSGKAHEFFFGFAPK